MSEITTTKPAKIVVQSLINAGVKMVFGIPGAKIDALFNELLDHPEIRLIVCRHEQNAAFIAAAIGRLTGVPGVCVATSGPGGTNLVTALATANTEGDPVVALVGSVPRSMSAARTHQSMHLMEVIAPIAKKTQAIDHQDQVADIILDAFRTAGTFPQGVSAIALPLDIMSAYSTRFQAFPNKAFKPPVYGSAPPDLIANLVVLIESAKLPVLLLGMRASDPATVSSIHILLKKHPIPVLETFQAAGCISRDLEHLYFGRLGLFRNQPGDRLLAKSDLVITVGYDPTEYDPASWNVNGSMNIVHLDVKSSDYTYYYQPELELVGRIGSTLDSLTAQLKAKTKTASHDICSAISTEFHAWKKTTYVTPTANSVLVHPLHLISTLQSLVLDTTVVCCDVGTVYIYMSRYFFSYLPRHFLVSNGQQTLGVALPWAIAASLIQSPSDPTKREKVISMSGDGGFMFTSQELSTAVQQECDITHFIWNDGTFNMVAFQEEAKYGRTAGIELGGVDFVKFAEAFGAKGFRVEKAEDLERVMKEALAYRGVSIVDIPIDYSHVSELMGNIIGKDFN
ncbi:acetolactate synthase [Hyaloscypha bicolor E]|uniref:Acetolactate synthase n=1 Tax=Hyaloscypha bicolor E TaxID=1095630 RepID=A0A2J6SH53_9HELO|nr:acetolactate synthase [Hyaloscypha bicolor E]PMD50101.1 acetolactate synthase [Hyaloscypha bicolor E]